MKFIRKFFDKQEKHFVEGGKLQRLYPLYEVLDTFFYTSGKTAPSAPHVRDGMDLKRMMTVVMYALVPTVLMAFYNTGYQANLALLKLGQGAVAGWRGSVLSFLGIGVDPSSIIGNMVQGALYFLPVYIVTFAVGISWEVLFAVVRKHEINEGFFVTSLLFPLILPPNIPLWQVAIGISFGVVVGKEVFGGTGMNILNPALTARAFLFFAYPAQISGDAVWVAVDGVSKATPLAALADPALKVTASWWHAFVGIIPGSMGETSTLACLIGAAILIITGIGSWRIMLSVLVGMVGMSLVFNLIGSSTNPMFQVNPAWHLVLGGFAFGTVYMATDPVTAAMTEQGKYLYGLLIGVLVILVRVVNPAFPEGMMLSILFGNMFAPIIDKIYINKNIKRRLLRNVV
ncbi:MAG TPA: NADH:ubiquinone reductase (Na(+)-transporting) subunit B [Caldithrix sp.]|nr:NADH:ubiquinone reductase (Na(+)-transporting) subunit B [Caldithrix sp.]